ncbi:MAG: response regulator [Archangium sp.]|nr:response regulator [Archangium sp.]
MAVADSRPVVLYVEDDADTFKIASLRLKTRYRLIWAQNDVEAVDLISFHQRELFAVLMDIELRGSTLDGLELVRLLKGHPLLRTQMPAFARRLPVLHNVPVIVLTAYAARYTEAEVHAVGAAHFVTKPIDFTRLNLALAQANIAAVMKRLEKAEPQPDSVSTDVPPPATPTRR